MGKISLVASCLLLLSGCGNSDNKEERISHIEGVLSSGPIQNAQVCYDENKNDMCDPGEIQTSTNS